MKYGVLLYQSGGCDYTIGCGFRFVVLPETVTNYEQACHYLANDEDSCLHAYGNPDSFTLYEIGEKFEFENIDSFLSKYQEPDEVEPEDAATAERRRQYEALKKEFN